MNDVVQKFCKGKSTSEIVDWLNMICEEKLQIFINKTYEGLSKYINAYQNSMAMDREVISEKSIWTAKKKYALKVWDKEGVRYDKPQMKIMGLEAIRTDTAEAIRLRMKEVIIMMLDDKPKEVIQDYIAEFKDIFYSYPISENRISKEC